MAVATYDQVRFAQAFLRSVGANWKDNYLILVVVAWVMAGNRGWNIRGNNPFLVFATSADARFRIGTFTVNGLRYSRYASLSSAFAATIATLQKGYQSHGANDLAAILRAFRAARGIKGAQAVAQALSNSPWDYPRRYRTSKGKNLILVIMSRFTGLQLEPPVKPPPKRPPPKPKPRFPDPGKYPIPEVRHDWPSPTAPISFLHERQWKPDIWTTRKS